MVPNGANIAQHEFAKKRHPKPARAPGLSHDGLVSRVAGLSAEGVCAARWRDIVDHTLLLRRRDPLGRCAAPTHADAPAYVDDFAHVHADASGYLDTVANLDPDPDLHT